MINNHDMIDEPTPAEETALYRMDMKAVTVAILFFFSVLFTIGECSPKEGKISKCLTQ
jgi:hypothetical protein